MESGMSSVGAYLHCDDRSMLVVFEHHLSSACRSSFGNLWEHVAFVDFFCCGFSHASKTSKEYHLFEKTAGNNKLERERTQQRSQ